MRTLAAVGLSLGLLVLAATQTATAAGSSPCGRPRSTGLAYHWPVKPFDRQHPVRGAFGDPRIVGGDHPFGWTGPNAIGAHSFHNGIDIVADDGAPVYPVVSGRVVRARPGQIVVHTDDGRTFQYYHLSMAEALRRGRCVVAGRTVLGWIAPRFGHVHLAEIDGHVIHNPLDPGHLGPYHDRTRPMATDLYVEAGTVPSPLDGRSVGPRDHVTVAAADPQAMPVPGSWSGLPQAPALVEWRLFHGRTPTPWEIAVDFRHSQPPPRYFWQVYGAGTYPNCPQFADRIYPATPGRYLFRVQLHLNRLHPGLYRLAVRVADVRRNRTTTSWPLAVAR